VVGSALSEELDRTDARYGVEVFWKAVLSNRTGYRMGVPTVRLAELYDGCRASVERKGGEVVLRAPVRALRLENGAIAGVRFDDGHEEAADAYVLAIPRNAVAEVLPDSVVKNHAAFANLEKLSDAPITGVHLWFDRPVMSERFLTLIESTTQWIFNKTALYQDGGGEKDEKGGQYLQLVISASYDLLPMPRQEIIDVCLRAVRQRLPAARTGRLSKAAGIKAA